jgi:hypothetical protein
MNRTVITHKYIDTSAGTVHTMVTQSTLGGHVLSPNIHGSRGLDRCPPLSNCFSPLPVSPTKFGLGYTKAHHCVESMIISGNTIAINISIA